MNNIDAQDENPEKEVWYLQRGELWVHRPSWSFYIVPFAERMASGEDTITSMGSRAQDVELATLKQYKRNPFRALMYAFVELYLIGRSAIYLGLVYTKLGKANRDFERFLNRRTKKSAV